LKLEITKVYRTLEGIGSDVKSEMLNQKEDLKERINDIDKYYSDLTGEMRVEIHDVRVMARDTVSGKAKELDNKVND